MRIVFITLLLAVTLNLSSQTAGNMTFTATTVNYTAQYSPQHILAIWVTDASDTWVKTREFRCQHPTYRYYLINFKNATSSTFNTVDAVTGATLNNHVTHSVNWDGTDVNGNLVADGDYKVYVEYTSANGVGKLYSLDFVKGPNIYNDTPADESYFTGIEITWTPDVTGINKNDGKEDIFTCYPAPFNNLLNINYQSINDDEINITVYDVTGKPIKKIVEKGKQGMTKLFWDGKADNGKVVKSGLYYIQVRQGEKRETMKVIKN